MRMHWLRLALVPALLVALGCRGANKGGPDQPQVDTTTHLGDHTDASLADLLGLPRDKLAALVAETADRIGRHRQEARDNPRINKLLPRLLPPAAAPVLQGSHYSAALGVSVPAWFQEGGGGDAELALHLARHGDVDGALKVAPADEALRRTLEGYRGARNYPVEWSQLVGLKVCEAELRLAQDDIDAATELALLHRQLREVLDDKARQGPLGAALLPLGRRALAAAAEAYRDPSVAKVALADDLDNVVKDWGAAPAPALPRGASRADVTRLFNVPAARERTVAVHHPEGVARAIDLLALPVVAEGVEAVVVFFDDNDRLSDVLFVYRGKISETFPEPVHLAHGLVDRDYGRRDAAHAVNLPALAYEGAGLAYEVTMLPRLQSMGALVRVHDTHAPAVPVGRTVGPVRLDATFEANRVAVDPDADSARTLTLTRPAAVSRFRPLLAVTPSTVTLHREGEANLLGALALTWPSGENLGALHDLALPLWSAYGPARCEGSEGGEGGLGPHLALVWQDGRTRLALRLPYAGVEEPQFVAADRRTGEPAVKERLRAAAAFDRDARNRRWGHWWQPGVGRLTRVARSAPGVGIHLGDSKEQALAGLPKDRGNRVLQWQPDEDTCGVLLNEAPGADDAFAPRQVMVRFRDGRVAELRVRYQEVPPPPGQLRATLVDQLRRNNGGFERLHPAPWSRLWPDLPSQGPPMAVRWADDCTRATLLRDPGGAELVLTDCPADSPEGVALPPLTFVSTGVDGCRLGDTRGAVMARFQVERPQLTADDGVILPGKDPYDTLVVYFEEGAEGRVTRILARHRGRPGPDLPDVLLAAWQRDWKQLGVVRRVEAGGQPGWGWHDDRTRVRIFAHEDRGEVEILTEWRQWPVGNGRNVAFNP